jgi:hypothetical protein
MSRLKVLLLLHETLVDATAHDVDVLVLSGVDGFDAVGEDLTLDELLHREEVVGEELGEDGEEVLVVFVELEGLAREVDEERAKARRELALDLEALCKQARSAMLVQNRASETHPC